MHKTPQDFVLKILYKNVFRYSKGLAIWNLTKWLHGWWFILQVVWDNFPKTLSSETSSFNSGQPWKPLDVEAHQKGKRGTDRALLSPSAHNSTSWCLPLSTTQSKIFRTCNEPWLCQEGFNYWKGKVSALSKKKEDIIHQYLSKAKVFLKLHNDIYGSVYVFEKYMVVIKNKKIMNFIYQICTCSFNCRWQDILPLCHQRSF